MTLILWYILCFHINLKNYTNPQKKKKKLKSYKGHNFLNDARLNPKKTTV
jgi:hypothetical protein